MNVTVRAGSSTKTNTIEYLSGFGNGFETEALPGALPIGRSRPKVPVWALRGTALRLALHSPTRNK